MFNSSAVHTHTDRNTNLEEETHFLEVLFKSLHLKS